MKEKKLFKNTDEFLKLNVQNDNDSHFSKYKAIVQALDFEACKEILFMYTTYKMLHNRKASIKFKLISLADLTCIAKACARMTIKNESGV